MGVILLKFSLSDRRSVDSLASVKVEASNSIHIDSLRYGYADICLNEDDGSLSTLYAGESSILTGIRLTPNRYYNRLEQLVFMANYYGNRFYSQAYSDVTCVVHSSNAEPSNDSTPLMLFDSTSSTTSSSINAQRTRVDTEQKKELAETLDETKEYSYAAPSSSLYQRNDIVPQLLIPLLLLLILLLLQALLLVLAPM